MTTNTDTQLIGIALQIAALDAEQQELLARGGKLPSSSPIRAAMNKRVSFLDADISQLCDELRMACQPPPSAAERAFAALPDCVAAVMLDHESDPACP